MTTSLKLAGITLLGLFIKWVLLRWASQKLVNFFDWLIKKLLGKYPDELAIWLHYHKKRTGRGHNYPNPLRCIEEECQRVHLY